MLCSSQTFANHGHQPNFCYVIMDYISQFKKSYALLQEFYSTWMERIDERCREQLHRRAAYYAWARYSMSMHAIDALLDRHLIADLFVICRGCLEFDVTLEAVIQYKNVAHDYLEFDKHAKGRYLRIVRSQGDIGRSVVRRKQFAETFGEDPDDYGRHSSWCSKFQGITGLMRKLQRTSELRVYNILSHFAHGSISAMQMLDANPEGLQRILKPIVETTYTNYLDSSRLFIGFIWEPLITPEGEKCKNQLNDVASAYSSQRCRKKGRESFS